jgi:hypothetical protein
MEGENSPTPQLYDIYVLEVPLRKLVRSLMGTSVKNAAAESTVQKMKGSPGLRLAKLLPRGGESALPAWLKVAISPIAIPKSLAPTPSVSNNMVTMTAIKPSIKTPDIIIKTQIRAPSARGKKPKQTKVTIRAGKRIAFLESSRSDNEDKGITHRVLNPKKAARAPSAFAGSHPRPRR